MKQTNNALTFLMAQYRAIFKNAYFKGIASALVLTAGLAAAQGVQADNATNTTLATDGGIIKIDGTTSENGATDGSKPYKYLQYSGSGTSNSGTWAATVNIIGGAGVLNASSGNFIQASGGALALSGSGTLTISGANSGLLLTTDNTNGANLTVDITKIDVTQGTLALTANSGSVTAKAGAIKVGGTNAAVTLTGASKGATLGSETSIITVGTGGTVTLGGSGSLVADALKVTGGTIKDDTALGNTISVKSVNFNGGTLTVNKGLTFENKGEKLDFSGATINVSGSLTLSGGTFDFSKVTALAGSGSSCATDQTIVTSGTTAAYGEKLQIYLSGDGGVLAESGAVVTADSLVVGDDTTGTVLLSSTSGDKTLALAEGSTFKVGTLNIANAVGSEVKGAIRADNLEFSGSVANNNNLDDVIVAKALTNNSSSAITLTKTLKLVHEGEDAGQITATTDDEGFIISDSTKGLDITGTWVSDANITVSGTGVLKLADNANLTVSGAALEINGANAKLDPGTGAKLTVSDGTLKVVDADADLSTIGVTLSGSGNTVSVAASSADSATLTITKFDDLTKNIYTASGASADAEHLGILKGGSLEATTSNFTTDNAETKKGIKVLANGVLDVDNLTLTGKGAAAINANGKVTVNEKVNIADGAYFSDGTLQLGSADEPTTSGSIESNLSVQNKTNVFGTWSSAEGKGVTVNNGTLSVGSGSVAGSLTTDTLAFAKGSTTGIVKVDADSSLNVNGDVEAALTDFAGTAANNIALNDDAKLNVGGTLKIAADAAAATEVKAAITAAKLDLGADLANLKLSDTTVSNALINSKASGDVTLAGQGIKLVADSETVGQISGAKGGFVLSGADALSIQGSWDATTGLTVSGAKVNVDGGSLNFAKDVDFTLNGGTLNVKNGSVDLAQASISGSGSANLIQADSSGTVFLNGLAENVTYKALAKGTLDAGTELTVDAANIVSGGVLDITKGGTLQVGTLTLTGIAAAKPDGTLIVSNKLAAANGRRDVAFDSGTLRLDSNGTNSVGSIGAELKVQGKNTTDVLGTWTGSKVNVSGGTLNVGTLEGAGNLTVNEIAANGGNITVLGSQSIFTVNGKYDSKVLVGANGYYGFGLSGATVNVDAGTFVIGSTVAGSFDMSAAEDKRDLSGLLEIKETVDGETTTKEIFVHKNFGTYSLSNAGTLQLNFATGTKFTQEEYEKLRDELLTPDSVGSINLGGATIDGIENGDGIISSGSGSESGSTTLDYSTYQKYQGQLAGLESDKYKASQLTNVNGPVDRLHIGSIQLADGFDAEFIGGMSSLNTAVKDADGNDALIVHKNGTLGDAVINDGSNLVLNDDGAIGNVTLEAGADERNATTLTSNKANTVDTIDGAIYDIFTGEVVDIKGNTKVQVGASGDLTVNKQVIAAEVNNAGGALSVAQRVGTEKLVNSGSISISGQDLDKLDPKDLIALYVGDDGLTNTGANSTIDLANGSLDAEGKLSNEGQINVANGSLFVKGSTSDFANASGGAVNVSDRACLDGKVDNAGDITVNGKNLLNIDGFEDASLTAFRAGNDFSNAGSIAVGFGAMQAATKLTNDGTITVSEGRLNVGTTLSNTGSIAVSDTVTASKFSNTGSLTVGGDNLDDLGTDNTVALRTTELNNSGAESSIEVALGDVETGKLNNDGSLTVAAGYLNASEITTAGTLSVNQDLTAPKFISAAGSDTTAKTVEIQDEAVIDGNLTVTIDTVNLSSAGSDDVPTVTDPTDPDDKDDNTTVIITQSVENPGFILNSTKTDSRGRLVNAAVKGSVNAARTTSALSNTTIETGGSVNTYRALLSNDIRIDGDLTVNDNNNGGTLIGAVVGKTTTDAEGNPNATTAFQSANVTVTGTASLGNVEFAFADTNNTKATNSRLDVLGGSVVTQDLTGARGAVIAVGSDNKEESSSGNLDIQGVLYQNGATLVVDPAYDQKTAVISVNRLAGYNGSQNQDDVGIFYGNVYVGQNSALGVGNKDNFMSLLNQYQVNGALVNPNENENAYGAILYLDRPTGIDSKYGITLTSQSIDGLKQHWNKFSTNGTNSYAVANTLYLGFNTALAVNTDNANNGPYIKFLEDTATGKEASGSKVITDGGDVVLYGNHFNRTYQIFNPETVKLEDIKGAAGTIDVISANELLVGQITSDSNGNTDGKVFLKINEAKANTILGNISDPVRETLLTYVKGYHGEPHIVENEDGATTEVVEDSQLLVDANGNSNVNNEFLSSVILEGRGTDAEIVSRLGAFGGAAQAALMAGNTTYEAIMGRFGGTSGVTVADNAQGGALWISPVYKNHSSDGFDAQGLDYGVDVDLYGLTLGADFTLANGVKFGAAFNVGSGDADGDGIGSSVSNDFDYYGFSVYGGYTYGPLSVIADVSYTQVDNDVDGSTSLEKVSTSFDSSNLSIGVTGSYQIDQDVFTVTPHAGLRFSSIDLDDYTVGDFASYESDNMTVFSIPVGVTVSKEFVNGSWTVKPSFDFTMTANLGDDCTEGTVHWAGIENLETAVSTEVLDNFTYGASVGVDAKSGNFSLGFGLNYTGSSNTDEFGLNANARFVF